MKVVNKIVLSVAISVGLMASANAHDPKMHMKKAEKADCSKMDHSKMDMKDPVAMAMMKKCMKQAKEKKMDMKNMKGMDMKNIKHYEEKHEHDEGNEEHQHH
jgi:hypothetical protein